MITMEVVQLDVQLETASSDVRDCMLQSLLFSIFLGILSGR